MHAFTPRHDRQPSDRGSALIITLMVMAVLSALATTVTAVTINNLQSSWRAQQAGAAVDAADAGVAQAVAHLRNAGLRGLSCSPTCATNPWGNRENPAKVVVAGTAGEQYQAWIEPIAAFPANNPGRYRIHSTGTARGAASRAVVADVEVTTTEVPKGIFARTINGGGSASVTRESIFSTGCVYDRSKITMSGMDLAYGIPVAVHSSQTITESNGSGQYCPTTNKPIHRTGTKNQNPRPCNTLYPYDQDRLGAGLVDTACESTQSSYPDYYGPKNLDSDADKDVEGSFLKDDETLLKVFGLKSPALSQTQIDQMRTIAQSQGNHWTSSTTWSSPDEAQAVMFFDLTQTDLGGVVDLNDIIGFSRSANVSATDPACPTKSLIIVIEGGNVKLNSNQQLFASLFLTSSAPYGQVLKANGSSSFIGSISADTINLTGTADLSMDECFLDNTSPALLDFSVGSYQELDR